MSDRAESLRRVEAEIVAEKAAALGRAGERLEAALEDLNAITQQLKDIADPLTRDRLRREYEDVRHRATGARLALVIQREALGLRNHRILDQQFPEPPRLGS